MPGSRSRRISPTRRECCASCTPGRSDGSRRAVAEVAKPRGDSRRLQLAPGDYLVKKRDGDSLLIGSVTLADGPVEVADALDRIYRR